MEFNTGGTADSSNSGAMTGGTMASSMYKTGGGVGRNVSKYELEKLSNLAYQLQNVEDSWISKNHSKFVEMQNEYKKQFKKVYGHTNYKDPNEYAKGGGLKPIPKGNKGLPKLPKSVRNKMGYMAQGGGVGNYRVEVNQYIPYRSDKGVNYYYVIDSNRNVINKNTGKIYRGKQMDNYKFSLKEEAQKFADKLNETYAKGGGLKPIPKGNKGLPKLPESVRNKMGYMAQGGGVEDSNKYLVRYSQTNQQVEVLEDIIPVLNKYGIKLNYGTSVGKRPQTIIFDKRYQDSILRINADGYESEYLPEYDGEEFRDASDLEDILKNSQSNEMAKGGGTKKNITTKKTKTMDKKWSKLIDKAKPAKKPGYRKSPSGGYTENRANRSDANQKTRLEWGGTAESSETGEPIGGENQSSMFSDGGNIGGFTYSIGGL